MEPGQAAVAKAQGCGVRGEPRTCREHGSVEARGHPRAEKKCGTHTGKLHTQQQSQTHRQARRMHSHSVSVLAWRTIFVLQEILGSQRRVLHVIDLVIEKFGYPQGQLALASASLNNSTIT